MQFFSQISDASLTALGFFWKAGWAFILGYSISAMIETFVPKKNLVKKMGSPNFKSVSLATFFGAISSSCSFAALAAAKALVKKGAHFITAVAFMFASTNLVIELGILIFIFLGWQYLIAEIVGGLLLIAISSLLIKMTYPEKWLKEAREKVEDEGKVEEEFDPMDRLKSLEGWKMVGHKFVMEWKMVWQEVLIGFTVAGFVKVFVPQSFWETIFLMNANQDVSSFVLTLENALVAPFVAAATFIGSMGNIPLATVLAGHGVTFAGIMGFIYSDLMVPPLVKINGKYYGYKVALYIAGIMYLSIVATALILHHGFSLFDLVPEATQQLKGGGEQFAIDYTFYLNIVFVLLAGAQIFMHRSFIEGQKKTFSLNLSQWSFQDYVTLFCSLILIAGLVFKAL